MDATTFASTDWLADGQLSSEAQNARQEIGGLLGSTAEWYTDPGQLNAFFERLQSAAPALLDEMGYAESADARSAWFVNAATALAAPPAAAQPELTAAEAVAEAEAELARLVDDIDAAEAKELVEAVDIDPVVLSEFVKDDSFMEGFEEELGQWDIDSLLDDLKAGIAEADAGAGEDEEGDDEEEQA